MSKTVRRKPESDIRTLAFLCKNRKGGVHKKANKYNRQKFKNADF